MLTRPKYGKRFRSFVTSRPLLETGFLKFMVFLVFSIADFLYTGIAYVQYVV